MNIFSRIANRVGSIVDIKRDVEEAKRLAGLRKYRSAINILDNLIERDHTSEWSIGYSVQQLFVDNPRDIYLLSQDWKLTVERADTLIKTAREQMSFASSDPLQVESIEKALSLYSQANKLIDEIALDGEIKKCNLEYHKRNRFKYLLGVAKQYIGKGEFQRALVDLTEAQKLYDTNFLTTEINNCKSNVQLEIQFKAQLVNIRKAAQEGSFSEAILLLETALTKFSNSDGLALKAKLDRIVKGRFYFLEGLKAENSNHYSLAESFYLNAIKELPELTESKIRLAVILIKTFDYSKAIFELRDLQTERANYLRGFAYAKQGKFKETHKAWQACKNSKFQEQILSLKTLIQQHQAQAILKIENYVNEGKLSEAELESQSFLQNYGIHEIVQNNLEKYIQPCLAQTQWKTHDWQSIHSKFEQDWRNKLDIESLHNWAVATYYYALENSKLLPDLILVWSTALANFDADPAIKDLLWLRNSFVSFEELRITLIQLIEDLLNVVKDKDLNHYLLLRDMYRKEMIFLKLISDSSAIGLKANQLTISPSCFEYYKQIFPRYSFPQKDWATLYTTWGDAVAACLDSDVVRAIQIKPSSAAISDLEKLAQNIVLYYESCYHLKNLDWKKSFAPLQQIKSELQKQKDWQEEINKLCIEQRQNINELQDHLKFAQFWYELVSSQAAKSYLTEFKAEEIRERLAADKISFEKALKELSKLRIIDQKNPILIELIDRVEISIEFQEIQRLFKQNRIEDVITKAKRSRHESIRTSVLDIISEILVDGIRRKSLSGHDIYQLGKWAYAISPNDPDLQSLYINLGLV
ncbi:MAG: hypothetical protein KME35_07910 [Aphanocapsa sp. GSE-SYN-MK-11-07L]|nr:hypothetical protein [Aphanocapsa sp. GSE-SYN-MK-11-07L]